MRALTWRGETTIGDDYTIEEIPAHLADAAHAAHHALIEQVADFDEELMETYLLDEESVDATMLERAVRSGVLQSKITAVLCGSAFKNKGVQPLLDAVIAYLPSPLDVPAINGFKPGDESTVIERHPNDGRPVLGTGVQDRRRPAPGPTDLHPALLGQARGRVRRFSTRPRVGVSGSARSTRCTPTSGRRSRPSVPVRSSP